MPSTPQAQYPLATWASTPNFNRGRSQPVDLIVIHVTDGQAHVERTVARFAKPETQASAHFVVGQAGEVYQLVLIEDRAWHDSGRNGVSVGIEHVARTPGELGPDDAGLPLTDEQLAASAKLVAWLLRRLRLDIVAVTPHCSSPTTTHKDCGRDVASAPPGIWPWARYREMVQSCLDADGNTTASTASASN